MVKNSVCFVIIFSLVFLFACSESDIQGSKESGLSNHNEVNPDPGQIKDIERTVIHGNYIDYDKEQDMYDDADLVVIAHSTIGFLDREHVMTMTPADEDLPETIEDFYTRTPILITEILKTPNSTNINDDDILEIIEPITFLEEEAKILSIENYIPLEKDVEYIIYLKENTYGEYSVINMNNGRFSLNESEEIVNLAEHGHHNDKEKHDKLRKQVLERIKKQSNKY